MPTPGASAGGGDDADGGGEPGGGDGDEEEEEEAMDPYELMDPVDIIGEFFLHILKTLSLLFF